MGYLINSGGKWPAPGTVLGPSDNTASGGKIWARFAAEEAKADLFNYAVAGAACDTDIIYRPFAPVNGPFPGVKNDEIPAFQADIKTKAYKGISADNTVYALWIGTNDLGYGAFLTDSQGTGYVISDFVDCVWDVFDSIHAAGGRRFVLLNQAPLEVAPMYSASENINSTFWPDHTLYNVTEYGNKIQEYTTNVNTIFDYGVPFQLLVEKRWPGTTVSIFHVHELFLDVHDNPEKYLKTPVDVDGFYHVCDPDSSNDCVNSKNSPDSFLWYVLLLRTSGCRAVTNVECYRYDSLHASEITNKVIAKEFVGVVNGESKYGKTYKSKC